MAETKDRFGALMQYTCPHCRKHVNGPQAWVGKKARCSTCEKEFILKPPVDWEQQEAKSASNLKAAVAATEGKKKKKPQDGKIEPPSMGAMVGMVALFAGVLVGGIFLVIQILPDPSPDTAPAPATEPEQGRKKLDIPE